MRRSLSHVGGAARITGDPEAGALLAEAVSVPTSEEAEAFARGHVHGFHTYPARMHPITARRLVEAGQHDVLCRAAQPLDAGGEVLRARLDHAVGVEHQGVAGAERACAAYGISEPEVIRVPGTFELPVVAAALARAGYDAVVIATPAHGTAFDIAGTGVASVTSSQRALDVAIAVAGRRAVRQP